MSVRWDPLLARALAAELHHELSGGRVRALLLETESRRVLVYLREATLALELHPTLGWVSLLPPADPLPEARPFPVRVQAVRALPDESAVVFDLPRVRGRDEGVELVVEWVSNRWNAVVLGHRSRVIRHVLLSRSDRHRSLTVGERYEPPPTTGRRGVDADLSREEWDAILSGEDDPEGDEDPGALRRALLRGVAFTSSLNAPLFLVEGGWERWRKLKAGQGLDPHLLETERGHLPYPVPLPGVEATPVPTLLEAFRMARVRVEGEGDEATLLLSPALVARTQKRVERARRRVAGLERELESAGDPQPVRALGDLLLARFGEVPRGVETATLTDFEGNPVEVELDPALSPDENARRYYDEAGRLERARAELPKRIRRAEQELEEWEGRLAELRDGRGDPGELARRLGPAGPGSGRGDRSGSGARPPYHRFVSSGGLEIRVGRGARTNDDLTFRHSSPDDVWLHTRQAPGAHVILRWGRKETPPQRDLLEAATLAALNSEARHSGSVPVDWTFRKYVRKPRKAAPGAVVPERVRTLFVEPDPELLDRLAPDD